MKKLVTLAIAGTFTLGLTACGSGNDAEQAVEDFAAAAKDKDYAALCDAFDPEIIKTLEDAGHIRIRKATSNSRVRTSAAMTPEGRAAYDAHVAELRRIVGS